MADRSLPLIILLFSSFSGPMSVKGVTLYFRTGGTFTLDPGVKGTATAILWKHGFDKAVEWSQDAEPAHRYRAFRQFEGKSELNITTGALTVRDLRKDLSGTYHAEVSIQGKLKEFTQVVEVLDPVSELKLSCVQTSDATRLTCSAKGQLLEYRWSGPDLKGTTWRPMHNGSADITDAVQGIYSCEVKNPVSEKNDSFNTQHCGSTGHQTIIVTVVLIVICIVIAIPLIYYLIKRLRRRGNEDVEQPDPVPQVPQNDEVVQGAKMHSKRGEKIQDESQPLLPESDFSQNNDVQRSKSVKDRVREIEQATPVSSAVSPPAKPPRVMKQSPDHNAKLEEKVREGEQREKSGEEKGGRKDNTVVGWTEEGVNKEGKEKGDEKERGDAGEVDKEKEGREEDKSHIQGVSGGKIGTEGNTSSKDCWERRREDEKEEERTEDEREGENDKERRKDEKVGRKEEDEIEEGGGKDKVEGGKGKDEKEVGREEDGKDERKEEGEKDVGKDEKDEREG